MAPPPRLYPVPYSEHSSFSELTCFAMSFEWGKMIATVNLGSETSRGKMAKWVERWEKERRKKASERKSSGAWASSQSSLRNPVSLRLYKVLGTNYDDESSREGLQTLSELYASTSSTNFKGKEISKDVNGNNDFLLGDNDNDEQLGTEEEKASILVEIHQEKQQLERGRISKEIWKSGQPKERLVAVQKQVSAMHISLEESEKHLQLMNEASKSLLDWAGNLREEMEVQVQKSIVSLFLARFTLSEEETEALTSRNVPVGKRFFQAMDKMEQIREDCCVLMAGEDGPMKAGLDATPSLKLVQQWEKPFVDCELHAHDPLQYIGDMLAWVHQAIAGEREFLEVLFSMKEDGRMVGSAREFREKGKMTEEEEWTRELMDAAVGKVRVQQTVRSQERFDSSLGSSQSAGKYVFRERCRASGAGKVLRSDGRSTHQAVDSSESDETLPFPRTSVQEEIFLCARDVFFGSGALTAAAKAHVEAISRTIGTQLELEPERQQWLFT
ncbi:hypothetical protein BT96DRAFT_950821 [Gymnopus androsaceus JB14]|uniref:Conserved oligomeric Golgi complex subunit 6 n=1 Tax=Gymnopus androsaceus JB14 TaxID=1447944 RepID=A0A6A4GFC5_9AGAR|nr:hypothetical protein BT96DRAFT_950821 [Gymnopus androsaceus JB14]